MFEYKDSVKQLNVFNFNLIKKLLKNEKVRVLTKYYCPIDNMVTTNDNDNNTVEITLDYLQFIRTSISGLKESVLGN